jgi:hypothetical protein
MKAKRRWYKRPLLIIILVVIALPIALIGYTVVSIAIEARRPTYYPKGSDFPLDELPPSAYDVRFAPTAPFAPLGRAYEFRCKEQEYRDWVHRVRLDYPKLGEIRTVESGRHPTIDTAGKVELQSLYNFLISEWRFEDQGLHLVYDRASGRAIRWSHSR